MSAPLPRKKLPIGFEFSKAKRGIVAWDMENA